MELANLPRMAWSRAGWLAVWLGIVACGGNVSGGSDGPEGDPDGSDSPSREPDPSSPDTVDGADTALGDCKLGPRLFDGSDEPCAWVAKERCYAEREMACNCACPRGRNSQCASGFDAGPNGQVWVSCE